MSISFTLASRTDNGSIDASCPDAATHRARCLGTCSDPTDFTDYGCCDCTDAAEAECLHCSTQLNVSNDNAHQILERLGIDFDHCGVIDPADLFGRAAVGNIGRDDSGVTTIESKRPGRATIIECGVAPGYFEDRLGQIAELASIALERGLLVAWG
jgi:hypothetical protein